MTHSTLAGLKLPGADGHTYNADETVEWLRAEFEAFKELDVEPSVAVQQFVSPIKEQGIPSTSSVVSRD